MWHKINSLGLIALLLVINAGCLETSIHPLVPFQAIFLCYFLFQLSHLYSIYPFVVQPSQYV